MPLVGYHLIGFDHEPISFNRFDFDQLRDPAYRERTIAFFADCPHRLNFFFHNKPWSHPRLKPADGEEHFIWLMHGRIGHRPRTNTRRTPQEDRDYFLGGRPTDPDAINVVFTNNATGTPKIPLTPWMMAHRMGHMQMLHQENTEFVQKMGEWGDIVLSQVYDYHLLADRRRHGKYQISWSDYQLYPCGAGARIDALFFHGLWKALTISRAGRTGHVNGFEYMPEWMAQYLRFGEIRFPDFVPDQLNLRELHPRDGCIIVPIPKPPEGQLVARMRYPTAYIARYFEQMFEGILNRWRGEVIVT